ncbi:MAG: signal peptide peptidase SppA, partial [Thermoguttaceae bacterium]
ASGTIVAEAVEQPKQSPRRRSRTGVKLILLFLVLGLAGSLLLNVLLFGIAGMASLGTKSKVREEFFSHNRNAKDKVAIITVSGAILTSEGFVKRQIDRAAADPSVKAVVLRINSPGGTMNGSDYLYHHLRKLSQDSDIPIVASFGGLAASGGYYIAMAVGDEPQTIFAEPTTWTGSIGVVIPHYDLSDMLGNWGVREDSFVSKPLKNMGSMAKRMTEEEKEVFKGLVDESFQRFKDVIKQGRPDLAEDPDALDRVATGQIFTAQQARKNGLVDKIGFIEDAVKQAIKLARLNAKNVKVVRYKPEPTLATILLGSEVQSRQPNVSALLDMATPRPYYLYSWPLNNSQ